MSDYVPAFKCLTCEEQGKACTWSSSYRRIRYFSEEGRTQLERIANAHNEYFNKPHKIVKVK